jgi:CBS domain-containing protein
LNLMTTPVRALIKRAPITLPPTTPASCRRRRLMREQRVSSVLLVEQGHLFGLVTDRDLRNRVLAAGLDPALPVLEIATVAPLTVDIGAPAFEALLLMARHNIHHVPVLDGQRVVGMITATDLTEQHSTSAVYLAGDIHKQTTLAGLVAARQGQAAAAHLAAADASAYSTGHIVTAITDAITAGCCSWPRRSSARRRWTTPGWPPARRRAASRPPRATRTTAWCWTTPTTPRAHGAYFKALATLRQRRPGRLRLRLLPRRDDGAHRRVAPAAARWAEYFRRWTRARAQGADADLRVLRPAR